MNSVFNFIVPDELNPEKQKNKKKLIAETDELSKDAIEAKSRFEKSLLELEDMLRKNHRPDDNMATK